MAVKRVHVVELECEEAGRHDGDVETVEITYRSTGERFEMELCRRHQALVPASAFRQYGRPVGKRKPADRPQGLAGMRDMLRED